MYHPTDRITHTTAFVTPVVEHWLEREVARWVHSMKDRSDDPSNHGSNHERTLLPRSYISLLWTRNRSMGPLHEGSIRRPIAPRVTALTSGLTSTHRTVTPGVESTIPTFLAYGRVLTSKSDQKSDLSFNRSWTNVLNMSVWNTYKQRNVYNLTGQTSGTPTNNETFIT